MVYQIRWKIIHFFCCWILTLFTVYEFEHCQKCDIWQQFNTYLLFTNRWSSSRKPWKKSEQRRSIFLTSLECPTLSGPVDGTHVELHGAPLDDEYIYTNRKGKHSINVQLICNARYKITNVCARWPGSTHDSRVLRVCDGFISISDHYYHHCQYHDYHPTHH